MEVQPLRTHISDDIEQQEGEDIESWYNGTRIKELVGIQHQRLLSYHDDLSQGAQGRYDEEQEDIVPSTVVWFVVLDIDEYGGYQLHEDVYAEYYQVEYGI